MHPSTLAHNLDMTLDETKELMNSYFRRYSSAKEYIEECKEYCRTTGEIKTIFGDRIYVSNPKKEFATAGINYVLQNSASVLMAFGFNNMDYAIRQLKLDLHPKSVIHDSNQNEIWIDDLFYVAKCYQRFFRQFIKETYGVDFKYDLELMRTFRDHTVFEMDFDTSVCTFDGPLDDILYYEKYLKNKWKFKVIDEGKQTPASDDLIRDFCDMLDVKKKPHLFCMNPNVKRNCPMVSGRKLEIIHDWKNDELMKKILSMPMDTTQMDDVYSKEWGLKTRTA